MMGCYDRHGAEWSWFDINLAGVCVCGECTLNELRERVISHKLFPTQANLHEESE